MNRIPFLLDYDRWTATPDEETHGALLILCLGELAGAPLGEAVLSSAEQSLPETTKDTWQRAVAREILLDPDGELSRNHRERMLGVRPFDNSTISLGELPATPAACCIFPCDGGHRPPVAVQLWCLHGLSLAPERFESLDQLTGNGWFVVKSSPVKITRNSWQLAARLAWRAASEGSPNERIALAAHWIATGVVSRDRVTRVEEGNKNRLAEFDLAAKAHRRRWIVPSNWERTRREVEINIVETTREAWHHVIAEGISEPKSCPWPTNCSSFYSFVSAARSPLLLAFLILRKVSPQLSNVQLFRTSDANSLANATAFKTLFKNDFAVECEIKKVPANDPSGCQEVIQKSLHSDRSRPGDVFFSITNGNFLMRASVMLTALSEQQMHIAYKDSGSEAARNEEVTTKHFFTKLTFPDGYARPKVFRMPCDEKLLPPSWILKQFLLKEDTTIPFQDLLPMLRN